MGRRPPGCDVVRGRREHRGWHPVAVDAVFQAHRALDDRDGAFVHALRVQDHEVATMLVAAVHDAHDIALALWRIRAFRREHGLLRGRRVAGEPVVGAAGGQGAVVVALEGDAAAQRTGAVGQAQARGAEIPLPTDVVTAKEFAATAHADVRGIAEVADDDMILDVGPDTADRFAKIIGEGLTRGLRFVADQHAGAEGSIPQVTRWVEGATMFDAVERTMAETGHYSLAMVRPPGHHAEPTRSMGFCLFDNVAIAARYAMQTYGIKRVAIIDFDVHHGNGTEAAFFNDPSVLMCSFFQHPFYPFSGDQSQSPNMLNIPVPAFTKGGDIRAIVSDIWVPRLQEFAPQFVFISAGFDALGDARVQTLAHAVSRTPQLALAGFYDQDPTRAAAAEVKWDCPASPRTRSSWLMKAADVCMTSISGRAALNSRHRSMPLASGSFTSSRYASARYGSAFASPTLAARLTV